MAQDKSVSIKDLMLARQKSIKPNQYMHHEFQDYGFQLAEKLNDLQHKALYIMMAKKYPRSILEAAYSFVIDYPQAQSKGKLFMWKVKQINAKKEDLKEEK